MDTPIELGTDCMYQPNAVRLDGENGVVIYDACGKCPWCVSQGRTTSVVVAVLPEGGERLATAEECIRAQKALGW